MSAERVLVDVRCGERGRHKDQPKLGTVVQRSHLVTLQWEHPLRLDSTEANPAYPMGKRSTWSLLDESPRGKTFRLQPGVLAECVIEGQWEEPAPDSPWNGNGGAGHRWGTLEAFGDVVPVWCRQCGELGISTSDILHAIAVAKKEWKKQKVLATRRRE